MQGEGRVGAGRGGDVVRAECARLSGGEWGLLGLGGSTAVADSLVGDGMIDGAVTIRRDGVSVGT